MEVTLTPEQAFAVDAIVRAVKSNSHSFAAKPINAGKSASAAEPVSVLKPNRATEPTGTAKLTNVASPPVFLLKGVCASGKTEVYLQATQAVIKQGGSAIILVPEIAMTPQVQQRFIDRFGSSVAILHSGLTEKRRYEEWLRIKNAQVGDATVIVGARSALFAPVNNLQLIILDECHDSSYKSNQAPRYDARAVALQYGKQTGAVVVFGSATPSYESLYAVQKGQYKLLELPNRINNTPLPKVTLVDMRKFGPQDPSDLLSQALKAALRDTLGAHIEPNNDDANNDKANKAILLLNRRGFAARLQCRACGWVPTCPDCQIPLSYHLKPHSLRCHHCSRVFPVPTICPSCGEKQLLSKGCGTQQLETQLREYFADVKGVKIYRLDADIHDQTVLTDFAKSGPAILLGTQMVAKGLDISSVALVGVLNADAELYFPDFRSQERCYALLEQVCGRAGRGGKTARVLIQTWQPENLAIQAVLNHSPQLVQKQDAPLRKALNYPPYCRLVRLVVASAVNSTSLSFAKDLAGDLCKLLPSELEPIGPAACYFHRLSNKYRHQILIKFTTSQQLELLATALRQIKVPTKVMLTVDVDPQDTI